MTLSISQSNLRYFARCTRSCFAVSGLAFLAFISGVASASSQTAPSEQIGDSAEWEQTYDVASKMQVGRSFTPVLSHETINATEQMIERYRDIVSRGGWGVLNVGKERLAIGSKGAGVAALRQRLVLSGDIDPSAGTSLTYDSFVEAGVRRFQARHGLNLTGTVNGVTLAAMNTPADVRLKQLEINLVRLRTFSGNLGDRYVVANIPAALVETVERGIVATRHAAGVGKVDRQSPILQTKIPEVNFNPTWTVPASIIRKDLIPKMRAEPNYLRDNKIRVINGQGQEVPPEAINWNTDQATHYTFRQDPGGEFNSLGFVRINIPSSHGVYMHDTPSKGIFGDDFRFVSSGCIRVQNVRDYIAWLLKDNPGWDRAKVDEAINSGQKINVSLVSPVPVYWVYITAWAGPDGIVQFRDDIYGKDGFGPTTASVD
jgi:L,D-transpeptidase YcbB